MAGANLVGRPCQPSNPPPKQYKPPILTKVNPYGNLKQSNIQTKITNPCCRVGTPAYVTSYNQISTSIGKPTMTLLTGKLHPTLQKNTVKHEIKMVLNINTNNKNQQALTNPHPIKSIPIVNHHLETTQKIIPNNSLSHDQANGRHTINSNNKPRRTCTPPTHLSISPRSPPRTPQSTIRKIQPITTTHLSSSHPPHTHTHHSPAPPNPINHRRSPNPVNQLTDLDPSTNMMTTATQATLPKETALPNEPPTIKQL